MYVAYMIKLDDSNMCLKETIGMRYHMQLCGLPSCFKIVAIFALGKKFVCTIETKYCHKGDFSDHYQSYLLGFSVNNGVSSAKICPSFL